MIMCILHTGCCQPDGYGQRKYQGKVVLAHRLAYALAHGLDIFSMGGVVMHSCDTPACINPNHLSLGTQLENMKDCKAKGRYASKITQADADSIRARFIPGKAGKAGYKSNSKSLADEYSISEANVRLIASGKAWAKPASTN